MQSSFPTTKQPAQQFLMGEGGAEPNDGVLSDFSFDIEGQPQVNHFFSFLKFSFLFFFPFSTWFFFLSFLSRNFRSSLGEEYGPIRNSVSLTTTKSQLQSVWIPRPLAKDFINPSLFGLVLYPLWLFTHISSSLRTEHASSIHNKDVLGGTNIYFEKKVFPPSFALSWKPQEIFDSISCLQNRNLRRNPQRVLHLGVWRR